MSFWVIKRLASVWSCTFDRVFDKGSLPSDLILCSSEVLIKLLSRQEYFLTFTLNRILCKLFISKVGQLKS
jgi:hypothetical protein